MNLRYLEHEVRSSKAFLMHAISIFDEADGPAAPFEGGFTVTQQVAHIAQTVDWFIEGAERPEGFDLDFEAHYAAIVAVKSLAEARANVARAYDALLAWLSRQTAESLERPFPEGMVMSGEPRVGAVYGVMDHTAHHRGALSMYARALGKVAPMPYEAALPWAG